MMICSRQQIPLEDRSWRTDWSQALPWGRWACQHPEHQEGNCLCSHRASNGRGEEQENGSFPDCFIVLFMLPVNSGQSPPEVDFDAVCDVDCVDKQVAQE